MTKFSKVILLSLIFMLFFSFDAPCKKKKKPVLKPKYKKWITEEVGYIITKIEKQAFYAMENDQQRDMFIEAFWKNRDPNLNTKENEYKIEHYKRLKYANDMLGRGTPTPGWRTDMGRIYIILGEPQSIERYENTTEMYPVIIWFYQGLSKYGLPNGFSVVFFKEDNSGDYAIYSPVVHGPAKLLVNYFEDTNDYSKAIKQLTEAEPNVAKVSLSLIEGEEHLSFRPSIASELLLKKKITMAPVKKINDAYAQKLVKYKNFIDMEYSVNYISNSAVVRSFKGLDGRKYLHYAVEPSKLSMEQYDDKLYAKLDINGSLINQKNKVVYSFEKSIPVELRADQLGNIKSKSFSFQDIIPVIPGKYKFNVLIRNVVSKEFTSVEREIVVHEDRRPEISDLIFAYKIKKNPALTRQLKAFNMGQSMIYPAAKNNFTKTDTLNICYQLTGISDADKGKMTVLYEVYKDDYAVTKPVLKKEVRLDSYSSLLDIQEAFKLTELDPNYYSAKIMVYNGDNLVAKEESMFYVTRLKTVTRPWALSLSLAKNSPVNMNILGKQYLNTNQLDKAFRYFRIAYNSNPLNHIFAGDYCKVLMKQKKYDKVLEVGRPFMQTENRKMFWGIMGAAAKSSGKYNEAIGFFKAYLGYYGTNINVLNAIGESYLKLEEFEEAEVAYKKSLELMADQDKIKKTLKEVQKKIQEKKNVQKSLQKK